MNNLVFSIGVALAWPLICIFTPKCCFLSLLKHDKVWYRTDDLTDMRWSDKESLLISVSLLSPGQADAGSGWNSSKLQEWWIVSSRSVDLSLWARSAQCTKIFLGHTRCQSVHCSVSRGSADLCTYTSSPLGLILWTQFQPGTVQPGLHWCALICSYLNWMFNAFAVKLHWCTLVQSTLVYPWCALKSQEPVWCAGARHTACTTVPPALTTWAQLWHWTRRGLGGPWPPPPGLGGPTPHKQDPLKLPPSAVTTGRWPHDRRGPRTFLRGPTSRGWRAWSGWRCWTWRCTSTQWPSPPSPFTWLWQTFIRWNYDYARDAGLFSSVKYENNLFWNI